MKTLHVVGDSISLGYGPYLARFVSPWWQYSRKGARIGELDNPEGENGGSSAVVLAYLERARQQQIRWDVLLVNCGLHDIRRYDGEPQVPLDQYEANLRQLLQTYPTVAATLVWVRTTPVDDERHNRLSPDFKRYNADVDAYNQAADQLMAAAGIPSLDLNRWCQALGERELFADHVHFTEPVNELHAAFIAGQLAALGGHSRSAHGSNPQPGFITPESTSKSGSG